ncbi:HNH endonuclease domain-containing protein [Acinetobacter indicus]|uniref:HNH endonuclease domain-containing protein n=1 Tax=Acinetobacter indicus TaxID=756892 RepID=UPI00144488DE|nr:HNH endonuclease signature motif containing protein [Acinetobacter indicus]
MTEIFTHPSAGEQLLFFKNVQKILYLGSFTSTYKFALLMSLARLSVEQGEIREERVILSFKDIAEKFVELYWQQTTPYRYMPDEQNINNYEHPFILYHLREKNKQATIVRLILESRLKFKTLAALKNNPIEWSQLLKNITNQIKKYPIKLLQNIEKHNIEFLYRLDENDKDYIYLLPHVGYCLQQFHEIIEELCIKRWIDFLRTNKNNLLVFDEDVHNLETFLFSPDRAILKEIGKVLLVLQNEQCFYCGKNINVETMRVDHFIPWSMYSSDTIHNFVVTDQACNSKKSNYLATSSYYEKWERRNQNLGDEIHERLKTTGITSNVQKSANVARWAYRYALENEYTFWEPK